MRNTHEFVIAKIYPSTKQTKKYAVHLRFSDGTKKTIHFGANGYSDYTVHRDNARKKRYEDRHYKRENWTYSGVETPGFWSKWMLWNKPSITSSKSDVSRRFPIYFT